MPAGSPNRIQEEMAQASNKAFTKEQLGEKVAKMDAEDSRRKQEFEKQEQVNIIVKGIKYVLAGAGKEFARLGFHSRRRLLMPLGFACP